MCRAWALEALIANDPNHFFRPPVRRPSGLARRVPGRTRRLGSHRRNRGRRLSHGGAQEPGDGAEQPMTHDCKRSSRSRAHASVREPGHQIEGGRAPAPRPVAGHRADSAELLKERRIAAVDSVEATLEVLADQRTRSSPATHLAISWQGTSGEGAALPMRCRSSSALLGKDSLRRRRPMAGVLVIFVGLARASCLRRVKLSSARPQAAAIVSAGAQSPLRRR